MHWLDWSIVGLHRVCGSFFYGSVLGVFMLTIGWRRAHGNCTGAAAL